LAPSIGLAKGFFINRLAMIITTRAYDSIKFDGFDKSPISALGFVLFIPSVVEAGRQAMKKNDFFGISSFSACQVGCTDINSIPTLGSCRWQETRLPPTQSGVCLP
jgi:hypothetical protein